jgi:hypothetical protein
VIGFLGRNQAQKPAIQPNVSAFRKTIAARIKALKSA